MDGSILEDIRKMIGPSADYEGFDTDLITHINTTFTTLYQLGVGADNSKAFQITGASEQWSDFTGDDSRRNAVKSYIYIKTRLVFDYPSNSFVGEALKQQADELEYRLLLMEETPSLGGTSPSFDYDNYKYNESSKRWVDGDES